MADPIYDPSLLDAIEAFPATEWQGEVWRHMFASYPPEKANTSGARWNPSGVEAIYASLDRDVALAEAEHRLQAEPLRPHVRRTVYRLAVRLENLIDITSESALTGLGLTMSDLEQIPMVATQTVGGAVEWLGHDGLFVPSIDWSPGSD